MAPIPVLDRQKKKKVLALVAEGDKEAKKCLLKVIWQKQPR